MECSNLECIQCSFEMQDFLFLTVFFQLAVLFASVKYLCTSCICVAKLLSIRALSSRGGAEKLGAEAQHPLLQACHISPHKQAHKNTLNLSTVNARR